MRSIIVQADRGPGMAARMTAAIGLTRAVDGHLSVLVDTPISRYISIDPMGAGSVASEALNQALDFDDSLAASLQEQLAAQGVPHSIIRSEGEPIDALAAAARLADVVILSRGSGLAGKLAVVSRPPILVIPDDTTLTWPLRAAAIAWDGGDQAATALRAATPLLRECGAVEVLTIAEEGSEATPEDAVRYLSRHGVAAHGRTLDREGSTAQRLARAAGEGGAQLLVMGAFGHSQVREYLFGGVTRHFLDDAAAPALLIAH